MDCCTVLPCVIEQTSLEQGCFMMHVDICTVGGYEEVGKNMIAVKVNDTAVVMDMGFYMQKIMEFEEEGGHAAGLSADRMMRVGIRYCIDGAGQIYENNFLVGVEELANSSAVNILALQYERLIDSLGKELPKIRQIEKATKRLLGEPKLQSTRIALSTTGDFVINTNGPWGT